MFPFELSKGQQKSLETIAGGGNTFVVGSAGTGKSTIMEAVKSYYGDRVVFCATTGIANQRLFDYKGGLGTAARIFGLPMGLADDKTWREMTRYCNEVLFKSDKVEAIVIEECGMLNSEQISLVQNVIRKANKRSKKRRERQIQLIIVGDLLQLGTVVSSDIKPYLQEEYGSHLFFKAKAFEELNFEVCLLDEVKRQEDKIFKAALDVLRYGNTDRIEKCLEWFNRQYKGVPPKGLPLLSATNKVVNRENQKALDLNPNDSGVYTAEITGDYDIKNCPIPYELELKVGLTVMTLINDQEGRYMNGSLGVVEDMTGEGVYIKFTHNNEVCLVEPFEFEEQEMYQESTEFSINSDGETVEKAIMGTRVKGKCTHIPVKQATAMSIHKSQGNTISTEYVLDLGAVFMYESEDFGDFGAALAYVGFSRATDINNIYLKGKMCRGHVKVCEETIFWLLEKGAIDRRKLGKTTLAKYDAMKASENVCPDCDGTGVFYQIEGTPCCCPAGKGE
jgi:ATP-dependent exoDNAse (exonuclease V) alpha subunit